jgi:hypothetical protein
MKITPSGKKKRFKNTAYLPEPNVLLDLAPFRPFSLVVAEASLGQVPQPALDKKFKYSIVKKTTFLRQSKESLRIFLSICQNQTFCWIWHPSDPLVWWLPRLHWARSLSLLSIEIPYSV